MIPPSIQKQAWPLKDIGTALDHLALTSGLVQETSERPDVPESLESEEDTIDSLHRWMDVVALRLGIEVESFHHKYSEVEFNLIHAGPALLWLSDGNFQGCVALVRSTRRKATLLGPDLHLHQVSLVDLRQALCHSFTLPHLSSVEAIIERVGLEGKQRDNTREALLNERLRSQVLQGGWILRLPSSAPVTKLLQEGNLFRYIGTMVTSHLLQYTCLLLAWWMIGRGALQGRIDKGWLIAWLLLLISAVPLRLLVTWAQGRIAIYGGAILKKRLLQGALRLTPEEIRKQGSGHLLGQVLESSAVESLALSGGFLALISVFELFLAATILAMGAAGYLHVLLFIAWIAVCAFSLWISFLRQRHWTRNRLALTNDLVERMVGHRTRLAQQPKSQWHDGEDQGLQRYLAVSKRMDQATTVLMVVFSKGWLAVGLIGLLPAFVSSQSSTEAIAIGLGGVLLAAQALGRMGQGLSHIASALIAWEQVGPLFRAATRENTAGDPSFVNASHTKNSAKVLEGYELTFRYRKKGQPVIQGCSLQISLGEKLLLRGPSGGGKSTFASLLAGLRQPESGLLLLQGLDRHTLGEHGWRKRVVTAPQFHENHILTGTFSFNLLMGREWPPSNRDMREAYLICQELGLGPLLEKMPGGMLQMVGESGWQLSHGEKSRLFIARALLQHSSLILLDESFAALDPENLSIALQCVLERSPTLLVIAHP